MMRIDKTGLGANPNFGAIKNIRFWGLYQKYPEQAKGLLDALKGNPKAMDFCKKYDVDVVFTSFEDKINATKSCMYLDCYKLGTGKFKKFFSGILGNYRNIEMEIFAQQFDIKNSLIKSTKSLCDMILPSEARTDCELNGELDSRLEEADRQLREIFNKKKEKLALQKSIDDAKAKTKEKLNSDKNELKKSISELISRTK